MTDKELLELAAKAAGVELHHWNEDTFIRVSEYVDDVGGYWSPLTDDGDALRLAVKLGLEIRTNGPYLIAVTPRYVDNELYEERGDDPYAATRRAIVRAAAEIGKTIGETK